MSEFKRGDKVAFNKDGKELIGVIHAVGNYLAGVEVGIAYHAVSIDDLTRVTPAQAAGFKVGDKARVTVESAGFEVGTIVTLYRDDGSHNPLWEGPNDRYRNVYDDVRGRLEGAFISLHFVEKLNGPKKGVLWTDAPEGATHYSLSSDHGSKWHKLEDGEWFYHVNGYRHNTWQRYIDEDFAYVATQVAIPVEPAVEVVAAPAVPALDFSKWEKGDVVRATSDDSLDISVGHFYILTEDESRGWLKFRDDDNYPRTRHIENYELVLKRSK